MKPYHKIQTVFLRDPANNFKTLLEGQFAKPEFEFLSGNRWVFTEKVDGTNIRVILQHHKNPEFRGKTDNAQIHGNLISYLNAKFMDCDLKPEPDAPITLYGEGYGPKIQKGGGNYSDKQKFVLFDVRVGDWWLHRKDVEDIAKQVNVGCVPIVEQGSLTYMVEIVRTGFPSAWGDFTAEGLVARPETELQSRAGERIITKLKYKDFAR